MSIRRSLRRLIPLWTTTRRTAGFMFCPPTVPAGRRSWPCKLNDHGYPPETSIVMVIIDKQVQVATPSDSHWSYYRLDNRTAQRLNYTTSDAVGRWRLAESVITECRSIKVSGRAIENLTADIRLSRPVFCMAERDCRIPDRLLAAPEVFTRIALAGTAESTASWPGWRWQSGDTNAISFLHVPRLTK